MLIKILSAVINHLGRVNTVVSGGCYLDIMIIRKIDQKSRCCDNFSAEIFTEYDRRLPPVSVGASITKSVIQFDKFKLLSYSQNLM